MWKLQKVFHLNVNYDQSASRLHNLLDPSVPQEHKLLFKDHLFKVVSLLPTINKRTKKFKYVKAKVLHITWALFYQPPITKKFKYAMSHYLGTHASVPRNVEDQEDIADTLAVQLNIFFLNFHFEYLSS